MVARRAAPRKPGGITSADPQRRADASELPPVHEIVRCGEETDAAHALGAALAVQSDALELGLVDGLEQA